MIKRASMVAPGLALGLVVGGGVLAQSLMPVCGDISQRDARLDCYDEWAKRQLPRPAAAPALPLAAIDAPQVSLLPTLTPAKRVASQLSDVTRFWDLEQATARDTLEIRGYRPISLMVSVADGVNTLPTSPSNGPAPSATAFGRTELQINLSVRTKIASGLLLQDPSPLRDSLWFAYSQQSYWQLFNGTISRPFRATDHEPELIYVLGHALPLPGGWTYRMSGIGAVHQSNGQGQPLSRSWNRGYLMAAADKISANGHRFTIQARAWQRLAERADSDDNPDLSDHLGRAELSGVWRFDSLIDHEQASHTVGLVLRHSLKSPARGSMRIDYMRSIGSANSGLRFHSKLFTGYGDSLIDYNKKRTVLSLGLSLVDW